MVQVARREAPGALADLSVHLVGDHGLLLDSGRDRLYALNSGAAQIWSLLKAGKSPAEISRALTEAFGVSNRTASSWIADVLRQHEALRDGAACPPPSQSPTATVLHPSRRPAAAAVSESYELLGRTFHVHYAEPRLAREIRPLLRSLARVNDGMAGATGVNMTVASEKRCVIVVVDRQVVARATTLAEAAVTVRACLTELAVAASGGLCVVHAGALARDDAALLLPGEAGDGKSTLSAGLAARGFAMLSDDTTLLMDAPPLVRCLPTGLCLKRGACAVLGSLFPHLASLAEWRRPDGRQARYLMPGDVAWAAPDTALAVRWMVFPRYHPDHVTALQPLARHEALARLLRGVYFLSGSLDPQGLDSLIRWIDDVDCYELPLSSLDAAAELLDRLCR